MSVNIVQPTFAGGEISPSMFGRIDLQQYYNSVSLMSNFYAKKTGGAYKRQGFKFISSSKGVGEVRLIPMQIEHSISYVLEFGKNYIRFYANGGILKDDKGDIVEVATQFEESELYDIKYTTSKDVMFITHKKKGIFKLTRKTAYTFELSDFDYKWGAFQAENIKNIYMKSSSQTGTVTLSTDATGEVISTITYLNNNTEKNGVTFNSVTNTIESKDSSFTAFNALKNGDSFTISGSSSNNKSFIFSNYTLVDGNNVILSDGSEPISSEVIKPVTGDPTVTLTITLRNGFPGADYFTSNDVGALIRFRSVLESEHDKWEPERVDDTGKSKPYAVNTTCSYEKNVYKNVSGTAESGVRPPIHTEGVVSDGVILWEYMHSNQGYCKVTSVTNARSATAEVIQTLPEKALKPNKMFAKSYWGSGDGYGYPNAISFQQGRLWFAGTESFPEAVWSSVSDDYNSFKVEYPVEDNGSISLFLNSNKLSKVEHLFQLGDLIALSTGAEWVIKPQGDSVLTPSSAGYYSQSNVGCSNVRPINIDSKALYMDGTQSRIYDIGYNFESDKYIGEDITIKANHLFRGHSIIDWCYAREPNDLILMVRDDGILIGLTYLPTQQVYAYHRHHTDGKIKSICSVMEDNNSKVYMAVERTINNESKIYIESYADIEIEDQNKAFYLDSGLVLDQTKENHTADITSGSYRQDINITISNDLDVNVGDYLVSDKGLNIYVKTKSGTSLTGKPSENVTASTISIAGIGTKTITGLSHLEGKTVICYGDGAVYKDLLVSNGSISLPKPVIYAVVGLPYDADLQTLSLEQNMQMQGRRSNVGDVLMRLYKSRGIYVGTNKNDLVQFKARSTEDYGQPPGLKTGDYRIAVNPKWTNNAVIFVGSRDPLPLNIELLSPTINTGGR